MFQQHYHLTRCFICHPNARQSKMILKTLLKYIVTLSKNDRIHIQQTHQLQDSQGFLFLIKMMDLERQTLNHASSACKHLKIYNLFKKNVHCNSDTLNYLCRIAAIKISEKYYHMWLLECQVKNITQRMTCNQSNQNSWSENNKKNEADGKNRESMVEIKSSEKIQHQQKSSKDGKQSNLINYSITQPSIRELNQKTKTNNISSAFPFNLFKRK